MHLHFKVRRGAERKYTVYELLVFDRRIMAIRAHKYLDRIGYERTRIGTTAILKPAYEFCGWFFTDFIVGRMMCVYSYSDEFIRFYRKIAARFESEVPLRMYEVIDIVDTIVGRYLYYISDD